jgi:hypothetical protein
MGLVVRHIWWLGCKQTGAEEVCVWHVIRKCLRGTTPLHQHCIVGGGSLPQPTEEDISFFSRG